MKVVSVSEMRRLDELAQTQYGFAAYDLMREAGRGIAEEIVSAYQPQKICVVCGKGNNAGDGFVVAQRLHELGRDVQVWCLEPPSAYTGAARQAWDAMAGKIGCNKTSNFQAALENCELVVDALLGTGIKGAPRGEYAEVIRQINASDKIVVAADVPSGLRELTRDEEPGEIVCARTTITVGLPKTMLLTLPGSAMVGRLVVLPINFPRELLSSDQWQLNWALPSDQAHWLPVRPPDSNKGTFGHVGVIGGALEYAGASILVARAALRAGCGLATIFALPSANAIYKTALPEATSILIGKPEDEAMSANAAQMFSERCGKVNVLAMGPGLGTSHGATAFVQRVLNEWRGSLVLDADALNIISDGWQAMLRGRQHCIITPHPGEMARLTKLSVAEVQSDRVGVARRFAEEYAVVVLLKGAGTVIARPDGQVWLVPGAESSLAKGGTGDVLTGAIAALMAQGAAAWQAGILGATAHLYAGKRCAEKVGRRGVLASEVADEIPRQLDHLEKSRS